jgi:hypothetical protein
MSVGPVSETPGGKEMEQVLRGAPRAEPEHDFVAVRAHRAARRCWLGGFVGRGGRGGGCRAGGLRFGWLPGVFFGGGEEGFLAQQGADAVEADFGGGMKEAEGADAGKVGRQDVLKETSHEVQRLQPDLGGALRLAVAISPAQAAVGQLLDEAVAGGGFEDVTGKIAQRVFRQPPRRRSSGFSKRRRGRRRRGRDEPLAVEL